MHEFDGVKERDGVIRFLSNLTLARNLWEQTIMTYVQPESINYFMATLLHFSSKIYSMCMNSILGAKF